MALLEAAEAQAFVMGGGAGAERGAEGLLALGLAFRPEEEEDMAEGRGGRGGHKHGHQQVYLPKAKDSLRCIFLRSVFVQVCCPNPVFSSAQILRMRNCRNKSGGTGQHQTLIEAGPVPARLKNTSFPGFNFVYFLVIFITDSVLFL